MCRSQKTIYRSWLSLSITWILGLKLSLSGLKRKTCIISGSGMVCPLQRCEKLSVGVGSSEQIKTQYANDGTRVIIFLFKKLPLIFLLSFQLIFKKIIEYARVLCVRSTNCAEHCSWVVLFPKGDNAGPAVWLVRQREVEGGTQMSSSPSCSCYGPVHSDLRTLPIRYHPCSADPPAELPPTE